MLNGIKWIIKIAVFSLIVLVLGNWLQWRGKTVSDQVKTQLSHAQRSEIAGQVRGWATQLTQDAKEGAKVDSDSEAISSSERQKLKALIRQLNSSANRN